MMALEPDHIDKKIIHGRAMLKHRVHGENREHRVFSGINDHLKYSVISKSLRTLCLPRISL